MMHSRDMTNTTTTPKITATITAKGKKFLHQVYENGELIDKRLSGRAYAFVFVVKSNPENRRAACVQRLAELEKLAKKYPEPQSWITVQEDSARKTIAAIDNGTEVFKASVVNYTSKGTADRRCIPQPLPFEALVPFERIA